jgi:AcrR family transcriptional regulator
MSSRRPRVLRDSNDHDLRQYLIAIAARLIRERGAARLSVRAIAREAQVADGVLYNYFKDKEDLLAHALLAHVGSVTSRALEMPLAGTGTIAGNLQTFIEADLDILARVTPAFTGLLSHPKALSGFHAMIGTTSATGADAGDGPYAGRPDDGSSLSHSVLTSLPGVLTSYLRGEQRLGRVSASADVEAASKLITGAIYGHVVPPLLFGPRGATVTTSPGFARRLAETILSGIAPGLQAEHGKLRPRSASAPGRARQVSDRATWSEASRTPVAPAPLDGR